MEAGMQPPLGPPVWTALISLLPEGPPPISLTISPMVTPIGTSTSPVFFTLPTRLKILVPVLPGVPICAKAAAPREMIIGILAHVSTLLMAVGLPSMPFLHRIGGPLARFAPLPLDGPHQRRLLAAHESPGAFHDVDIERESRAQNVVPEEPQFARLAQRDHQVFDGQRILGAHVDHAFVRPGSVSADQHPLDDAVGIAFQNAAIHVRCLL